MVRMLTSFVRSRVAITVAGLMLIAGTTLAMSACGTGSPSGTSGSTAVKGSVISVNLAQSTFMLQPQTAGANMNVKVGAQTEFGGNLHGLADVKEGMRLTVNEAAGASGDDAVQAGKLEDEQEAENEQDQQQDVNRAEFFGTVGDLDSAHTTFSLTTADGTKKNVLVTPQTGFKDGVRSFADLKAGLHVEVKGTLLSDGRVSAASVEGGNQNENENEANKDRLELTGTISNLNAAKSSFTLTLADKSTKNVVVAKGAAFDGGFHSFADLKNGARVEIRGTLQTDGSVSATRVHREDGNDGKGDDHGGNSSGGQDGNGGGTSGGGSDDGGGHG